MTKHNGYLQIASISGVPIEVHWSFLLNGLWICMIGNIDLRQSGNYGLAYTLLILIHEAGHAVMARMLGLQVMRIQLHNAGGLCTNECPPQVWQSVLVFSAGLIAQLVTLLLTWAYITAFGRPESMTGQAVANTFIYVNAVVFIFCLLPTKGKDKLASDGQVLLDLYRHVHHGLPHPHPFLAMVPPDQSPVFPSEMRLLTLPQFRTEEFQQGVEILNNQTTSAQFVLDLLSQHLELNQDEAMQKMLEIHNKGGVLIPLPAPEKARSVADAMASDVRAAGLTLVCRYADVCEDPQQVS